MDVSPKKNLFNTFTDRLFSDGTESSIPYSEQREYQKQVFIGILKWVAPICFLLGVGYLALGIHQNSIQGVIIAVAFLLTSAATPITLKYITEENFSFFVKLFFICTLFLVTAYGLLQTRDFIIPAIMGSAITIGIAAFLEPPRLAAFWAGLNILSYIFVVIFRGEFGYFEFPQGLIHDSVWALTPVLDLFILAVLGKLTTQHFKDSLVKSEARRKQLERQERQLKQVATNLARSNRELQDFAYVASHDLQEPLRKIIAFGGRIDKNLGGQIDEQSRDYMDRMLNATTRMQQLIEALLAYSRVTTKPNPYKLIDLNKVVEEAQSNLEHQIEQNQTVFDIQPLPQIIGDQIYLIQLFQNLISNAIKYRKADVTPHIRIYAEKKETPEDLFAHPTDVYQIFVEDNGIGFEEQYKERIFGVFQRLHGRNEYIGSGIGLAICRKIVDRHGGTIEAQSEHGKGSKFIITLPYQPPAEELLL